MMLSPKLVVQFTAWMSFNIPMRVDHEFAFILLDTKENGNSGEITE